MERAVFGGAFLIFINGTGAALFLFDKQRAVAGDRRVPEKTVLLIALLGGWFGAKFAQRRYRHKTRKEPFRTRLNVIPALWCILVSVWIFRYEIAGVLVAL